MNSIHRSLLDLHLLILKNLFELEQKRNATENRNRKKKRIWTRDWILQRETLGLSNILMREL